MVVDLERGGVVLERRPAVLVFHSFACGEVVAPGLDRGVLQSGVVRRSARLPVGKVLRQGQEHGGDVRLAQSIHDGPQVVLEEQRAVRSLSRGWIGAAAGALGHHRKHFEGTILIVDRKARDGRLWIGVGGAPPTVQVGACDSLLEAKQPRIPAQQVSVEALLGEFVVAAVENDEIRLIVDDLVDQDQDATCRVAGECGIDDVPFEVGRQLMEAELQPLPESVGGSVGRAGGRRTTQDEDTKRLWLLLRFEGSRWLGQGALPLAPPDWSGLVDLASPRDPLADEF